MNILNKKIFLFSSLIVLIIILLLFFVKCFSLTELSYSDKLLKKSEFFTFKVIDKKLKKDEKTNKDYLQLEIKPTEHIKYNYFSNFDFFFKENEEPDVNYFLNVYKYITIKDIEDQKTIKITKNLYPVEYSGWSMVTFVFCLEKHCYSFTENSEYNKDKTIKNYYFSEF